MTDTPENLTLILLRRLDEKTDRLLNDMREVKKSVTRIERHLRVFEAPEP